MKRLTDELKRALSALAAAEAGEMLSRREKLDWLGVTPATAVPPPPGPVAVSRAAWGRPNREVAFAVGAQASDAVLDYVIGLCRRLEAGLAVLEPHPEWLPAPVRARLARAGIAWRLVTPTGEGPAQLERFIRENPQVLLIVSAAQDDALGALLGTGRSGRRSNGFPVPLVVLAQDAHEAA